MQERFESTRSETDLRVEFEAWDTWVIHRQNGRNPGGIGIGGMADHQYPVASLVGCASQVNGPFRVQKSGARFLHKDASGVGEFHGHGPSIVSTKQAKSMKFLEFRQLLA